jgi:homoserine kinase type II
MAALTHLDQQAGERIARAHGLGACLSVLPIAAGTVNSNYFLDTESGRVFVRVYEQQETDGVAYEWALLDHLQRHGVAVAERVHGPAAGELRESGKPIAVFRTVDGEDLCQARVTHERCRTVGAALARAAVAGCSFPDVRAGRFGLADVQKLHAVARAAQRPELALPLSRLEALADELARTLPADLPRGVVHGDLFRDNVLWQGERLVALLDWESASDGVLIYDLAVTILAWCCGDALDLGLARALCEGYASVRPPGDAEWLALRDQMRMGCLRFATTRITDVTLRGTYPPGYKDYRRFLQRLDVLETETSESLAARLR